MVEKASMSQATSQANVRSTSAQPTSSALSPKFVEPQAIYIRMNELYDAIARRAFELFENDGGILGRDLDHWFRAEVEFLHPAHVQIRESDDAISITAEVPGFSANELQLSLEPRQLTIFGKKQSRSEEKKANILYSERCSNELLRSIELPVEVNASRAIAAVDNGVLELTAPKLTAKSIPVRVKTAGAT